MALAEWEVWACAQKVIDDHGPAAIAYAEQRMIDLLTSGDEAGALAWTSIADRIERLQQVQAPAAARLH